MRVLLSEILFSQRMTSGGRASRRKATYHITKMARGNAYMEDENATLSIYKKKMNCWL